MTEIKTTLSQGAVRELGRLLAPFAAITFLSACGMPFAQEAPSYRYKETVVVETPQGVRTGSTVIDVRMAYVNFGDHTNLLPSAYKGQAVAVEMADGKVLFALLSSPEHWDWAKTAYQYLVPQQPFNGDMSFGKSPEYHQYQLAMALKGPQALPRYRGVMGHPGYTESSYPTLVQFRNINDPTTVEKVDPDHLDVSFGDGYKLNAIVLEKTDEPVSVGIEAKFSWIAGHRGSLAPSQPTDPKPKRQMSSITEGDFWTFGRYL